MNYLKGLSRKASCSILAVFIHDLLFSVQTNQPF